ncbi:DinB family protein [Deinococcus sonorensis]|uniref:DinB family protein n=2 Tax=Deinococcus sonorensis TaxID=309891 RepID=A0AAU7UDK8_9DEIO
MPSPALSAHAVLERERARLGRQLQRLPPEWLTFRPAPDEWSMLGVVDHLERVERALLDNAHHQLTQPPSVPDLRAYVTFAVMWLVMSSRLRIRTPGTAGNVAPQVDGLDLAAVWSRWDVTRRELAELLATLDRPAVSVFRHPVAGRLTARQGLAFMAVHFRHHGPQLARLKAAQNRRRAPRP